MSSCEVRVYDANAGKRLATCEGQKGAVYTVAFSPDGKTVASAGFDGVVRRRGLGEREAARAEERKEEAGRDLVSDLYESAEAGAEQHHADHCQLQQILRRNQRRKAG